MTAARSSLSACLMAALFVVHLVPGVAPALAAAEPAFVTDLVAASPALAALEPETARTYLSGTVLAYPEPAFDGSGNLVIAYHDNGTAMFARFNQTTTQALTAPTAVSGRIDTGPVTFDTGRGPHTALNGLGQLVTAYTDYLDNGSFIADRVYMAVHDLDGSQLLSEVFIGDSISAFWPAPSVAIGPNNSVYIAREISSSDYSQGSIGLEQRAADGSPILANVTIQNDTTVNHHPQIVADLARSRLVLAWHNDIGEERYAALDLNGSILWGPFAIAVPSASFSLTVGPDGSTYMVYFDSSGDLRASIVDTSGGLAVSGRFIADPAATYGRAPRCALSPQGALYIVWEEDDGTGHGDIRVAVANASTLQVTVPASWASRDAWDSQMPHIAFAPSGAPWIVWRSTDPLLAAPDEIRGVSMRLALFSTEARAPSENVTVYRGEVSDIPLTFSASSDTMLNFTTGSAVSNVIGPLNWTVDLLDSGGGALLGAFSLVGNGSVGALLRVRSPIWDPPTNRITVTVELREVRLSSFAISLRLNLTVRTGHVYAIAPTDQNATALPGATAQFSYQFRNLGPLEAGNIPITFSSPPPAGWSAIVTPSTFSALPGETEVVTVTITNPGSSTSADAYCAQLRVQHTVDVFSLATSTFCSRVALVATPRVSPLLAAVTVERNTTGQLEYTFEQVGNAAAPLSCHLSIPQALPAGWAVVGSPLDILLPPNTPTTVSLGVSVPASAAGGMRVNLTAQAACDGTPTLATASTVVTVYSVHDLRWSDPSGPSVADARGRASLNVSVQNLGNLPESLKATAGGVPRGWTVAVEWSTSGGGTDYVLSGDTAVAWVVVQAPARTAAGNYRVNLSFEVGALGAHELSLVVQVPATGGIDAAFQPALVSAGPGEVVSFVAPVANLGNAEGIYQLRVTFASTRFWFWTAEFINTTGAGTWSAGTGRLELSPFAEGTLYVYFSAPDVPAAGDLGVNISLTTAAGTAASFLGTIRARLPDLSVSIDAVPEGRTEAVLVGAVVVNVSCTGGVLVDNATLRVAVDGVRVFNAPVGPFCGPSSQTYAITVSVGAGGHVVTATVDPDQPGANALYGFVLEADESNNEATRSFSIAAAPPPPPPPSNTSAGGIGATTLLLAAAGAGGAAAVIALAAGKRRRGSGKDP